MAQYRVVAPRDREGCKPVPGVTTFLNCRQNVGTYGINARNRRLKRVGDRSEAYRFASIGRGRRTRDGNPFMDIEHITAHPPNNSSPPKEAYSK